MLFENGVFDKLEAGKFSALKAIHKYLFDEIFDFAGELRTVNISKGNFRFAPLMYLEAALANIDKMPQSTFDEIVEKYVEMNIAHPFREGNGRSTRIWLDLIFKTELHKVVDWSRVYKEDYLLAMERSPIKDIEIKHLLKNALTDEVDSREVYMKGHRPQLLLRGLHDLQNGRFMICALIFVDESTFQSINRSFKVSI